jgi:hypothetical protein
VAATQEFVGRNLVHCMHAQPCKGSGVSGCFSAGVVLLLSRSLVLCGSRPLRRSVLRSLRGVRQHVESVMQGAELGAVLQPTSAAIELAHY